MKKIFLIIFLSLFIPTIKINASCDYEEVARLKKIASNINASYVYREGSKITFSVTLTNLNEDIYFVDSTTLSEHYYKKNEITLSNYSDGEKIVYKFYSVDASCTTKPLHTISVSLPKYNKFYNDKVCVGAESYSLCQKWSNHSYDYSTFVQKVENYKKNKQTSTLDPVEDPNSDVTIFQAILQFLFKYYYVVLILIIGISIITIYKIDKRSDIYN